MTKPANREESEHPVPMRREAHTAFTFGELLAMLAIVGLLAALCLTARAGAKDQSLIAQCSGNLRQFALVMHLYGDENNDLLPTNRVFWPWDLGWKVGTVLTQWDSWRTFYCPGTGWKYTDQDNFNRWNYGPPTNRILGYATTFSGVATLNPTDLNYALTPQPTMKLGRVFPAPRASERVLLADVTFTPSGQNQVPPSPLYNWTNSAHLSGMLPKGCNVAMLDGHVEWRNFERFMPRTSGGAPVFWW